MTTRGCVRLLVVALTLGASVTVLAGADRDGAAPPQNPVASSPQEQAAAPPPVVKRYTGAPMSVDLQGADLRTVLRSFAETNTINMVIDPAVKGTVDVKLTDVPWDQALEIILRNSRLGYVMDGSVIRIAPLDVLASEEIDRQKLVDAQAPAAMELRTFALNYSEAVKIEPLIRAAVLSKHGDTRVDERTNTLIVRDLPDRLVAVADLVRTLDRAQLQVEIEARIIQTTHDSARELGIQWGLTGSKTAALGNTTNLNFPNSVVVSGQAVPASTQAAAPVVNLPVTAPTTAIGVALGSISGAFNLDAALSALQSSGKGRILSSPRVTTQNNQPAEVTQGVQIPIQTVANNTVTVEFKDAALTLKVTPQISSLGTVIMKIELENATPDFSRSVNNIPPIDTQRALTQVQVMDGATTVIGGIVVSNQQSSTDRTPGLSQLPLLGWLFRHDTRSDTSSELLIFITPRIIRSVP